MRSKALHSKPTPKTYAQNSGPNPTPKTLAQNICPKHTPKHTPKTDAQSIRPKHTPKTHSQSIHPKHTAKIRAQSSGCKDVLCEYSIIIWVQIWQTIAMQIPLDKLSSAVFWIGFYLRIWIRIHNRTRNKTQDNSVTCTSTTHHFHWMHSCRNTNSCS